MLHRLLLKSLLFLSFRALLVKKGNIMLFMSISPKTKRTHTQKNKTKKKKKKEKKGKRKKEVSRESSDFKDEITYSQEKRKPPY